MLKLVNSFSYENVNKLKVHCLYEHTTNYGIYVHSIAIGLENSSSLIYDAKLLLGDGTVTRISQGSDGQFFALIVTIRLTIY